MTPPRKRVGDGYGPGKIVVRKISDEGPQWMAEWHDTAGHQKHLTVAGGTAEDASRHAYVYRDGREKAPVLTPRKWTAADVTQDDVHFFDETCVNCVGYSPWKGGWDDVDMANLVAACWNRLEEKRAKEESDPFFDADHLAEVGAYMEERARKKLLAQALEALRFSADALPNVDTWGSYEHVIPRIEAAIAALENEVGA